MKISVIITTYNRCDALIKVLQGLSHQTVLPDEVIIADDGSTSDVVNKIKSFMKTVSYRIEYVWHDDKGFRASKIRNMAIKKATGDYLVMIDGDCIPDKYFIKDHKDLAQKKFFFQGRRILVGKSRSACFLYNDMNTAMKRCKLLISKDISNKHHLLRISWFPELISGKLEGIIGCNMGFFIEDLYAVNGFNENFVGWGREDSELVVRLYNYGLKRKSHPFKAVCYHLWHKKNDRNNLFSNDLLLEKAAKSGEYFCVNGLV